MITNNYQFIFDRLTQTLSDIFNKNQPVATHGYYASSSIGVVVPCVGSGVMPRGGWPPAPTSGGDGVLDGGMGVEPRAAPRV
jgi:hypothetical protein